MFTVEERDRVRNRLVQMSREDPRLVAGALVGSTAAGGGDQWSDLDLTFGLADNAILDDVLADWTASSQKPVWSRSPIRSFISVDDVQSLPAAWQPAGGFVIHSGEQVSRSGPQVRLALREWS